MLLLATSTWSSLSCMGCDYVEACEAVAKDMKMVDYVKTCQRPGRVPQMF